MRSRQTRSIGIAMAATAAAALLLAVSARADTMRCGKWVVDESMSPGEILAKCGEPTSKETKTEDIQGRTPKGYTIKRGTTTTETWIYGGDDSIAMKVVIIGGKVKSITRAE